jgi:hypothetical protein
MPFLQFGEPLPGLSHFLQPPTMLRRRCAYRHFAKFSGVPKIFVDFFQNVPSEYFKIRTVRVAGILP